MFAKIIEELLQDTIGQIVVVILLFAVLAIVVFHYVIVAIEKIISFFK